MQTIIVSSTAELKAAYEFLSVEPGGGEILLASGSQDMSIRLTQYQLQANGDEPVTIRSEDPENPVTVSQIRLDGVNNVHIRDVDVDSEGVPHAPGEHDLNIGGSESITLENVHFNGSAEGVFDPANPTKSFGTIRNSSDVTISDSSISNYFQGVFLRDSSGVIIEGTEFSGMQGDGIRMEGVQDIRIANNEFHSFQGSPYANNHDDMIQMWTVNTQIISRDIEITGNFFDSSNGFGTQTILIQNERDGGNPERWYENITISDNVIYNSHVHALRVSGVNGVTIENNTVLWNDDSGVVMTGADDTQSTMPRIEVNTASDITITGNIVGAISAPQGVDVSDNYIVTYVNASDPSYFGNHFINATTDGMLDLRDLALLPDSPWVGAGAAASQPGVALQDDTAVMRMGEGDDIWDVTLDASLSTVSGDAEYVWSFDDGTTLNGATVTHSFAHYGEQNVTLEIYRGGTLVDEITRLIDVPNRDVFEFDFQSGLEETSGTGLSYQALDPNRLAEEGYLIGGSARIDISRSNEELHNLDQFGFEIDLSLASPHAAGSFVYLHGAINGQILADGTVRFTLRTNEGEFRVESDSGAIADLESHQISVLYDGPNNMLELRIDGSSVDIGEASGTTAPVTFHGMTVGHPWGQGVSAVVEGVYFGHDLERSSDYVPSQDTTSKADALLDGPQVLPALLPDSVPVEESIASKPSAEGDESTPQFLWALASTSSSNQDGEGDANVFLYNKSSDALFVGTGAYTTNGGNVSGRFSGRDALLGGSEKDIVLGDIQNDVLLSGTGNGTPFRSSGFDHLIDQEGKKEIYEFLNAEMFSFQEEHGIDAITNFEVDNLYEIIDFRALDHLQTFKDVLTISEQQDGYTPVSTGNDSFILLFDEAFLI